jgi:hypothetical protein
VEDNGSLHFAVAGNGGRLEAWQRDAIARLVEPRTATPIAFFSTEELAPALPPLFVPECRRAVEARTVFSEDVIKRGQEWPGAASPGLHFVLDFRGARSRGAPLPAAKYGTWRFRFGDPTRYPGEPPCLWEMLAGDYVVAAALMRLPENDRGGATLKCGHLPLVAESYNRSVSDLMSEVSQWPEYVCRQLRSGTVSYAGVPEATAAPERARKLDGGVSAKLLWRLATNRVKRRFKRLFVQERWNIGVIDAPIARFLLDPSLQGVRWFPQTERHRFLADPFGVAANGRSSVLCEWYDYQRDAERGKILAFDFDEAGWSTSPVTAMELPVHASYPFLLVENGRIYCVPETAEANEVALYEAESFPNGWIKKATLLHGVAGNDTTICRRDGRWWLFTGLVNDGPMHKLYVWYADDLLGPWLPHAGNPVKIDVRSACGAGTPFEHEGRLYRPAQDCSRSYGGAVVINRIVDLTPASYREEPAATILPVPGGPYPLGVHTISAFGERTLVDGKYGRITGRGLRYQLSRPFRLLARIVRKAMSVQR